jgi:hypothetical protein
LSRTFNGKDAAWSYARDLWSIFKLPLRDLTDGNTAREQPSQSPKIAGVSSESRTPKIGGEGRR